MHVNFALLGLCASFITCTDAHWGWKTKTVTYTVTTTKTVQHCTTRCSSFGRQPCTPLTSTSKATSSTSHSSLPAIALPLSSRSSSSTASSHSSSTSSPDLASSASSATNSPAPSLSLSLPSPSSTPGSNTAETFFIRANSPTQNEANGQYAVVASDGTIKFTAASPDDAASFYLSTAGGLVHDNLFASITASTTGVSAVRFLASNAAQKRQTSPTNAAVTCVVTADANGAALLQCSADGSTLQQACGVGFYLGATQECQPLTVQRVTPDSAAATTNTPTRVNPTPGALFSLQANGPPLQDSSADFAGYFMPVSEGTPDDIKGKTVLAFSIFNRGAPFSLDADGHLVGVGPTSSGGNVAYAATFQIGSTFGPIVMMSGIVDPNYTPIVCRVLSFDGGDNPIYSLSCSDGASGTNMMLQKCRSTLFYLGTTLGEGCTRPIFRLYYLPR